MADIIASGLDSSSGQKKTVSSGDTLVNASGGSLTKPTALISYPFAAQKYITGSGDLQNYLSDWGYQGLGRLTWNTGSPGTTPGRSWLAIPEMTQVSGNWDVGGTSGTYGHEADGNGKLTSFLDPGLGPADDPRAVGFWLQTAIPKGFSAWSTGGITAYHKVAASGGGTLDFSFNIEVQDPADGTQFDTPVKASRVFQDDTTDASYQALTISAASLAGKFSEYDMLKLLVWYYSDDADGILDDVKFGRIELHWDG